MSSTSMPMSDYYPYPHYPASPTYQPTVYYSYPQPISDADIERIAQRVAELLKPKPRTRKTA